MSHILFINHTRELHGAEQVLLQSLQSAHEAGHRVTVVLPSHVPDSGLDAEVRKWADAILYLPYRPAGDSLLRTWLVRMYNSYAWCRLVNYIRREKVQVVYSNTIVTVVGVSAARWSRVKHVWHLHELPHGLFGWKESLARIYRRLMCYRYNRIVCISKYQRSAWEDALGMRLPAEVVYNPIRCLDVKPVAHDGVRIGYLGAFAKRKNIPMLVQAFEQIHARYPETELWLCGAKNAGEIEQIRALSAQESKSIKVMLATDDVGSFFAQIDIFVLPSYAETMPLVVMEAMQVHVCVLQTTQSGMSELLQHKKDCLFFPPTRTDLLVEQLKACMDKAYRETLATNGQKHVLKLLSNQTYEEDIRRILR